MSFGNAVMERMEDLRLRHGQTQRNELSVLGQYPIPTGGPGSQLPLPLSMLNDSRGGLTRRFTTDSARIPTLGSLAVQKHVVDGQDHALPSATQYKVQLLEKKKLEYERLKEQKRRYTAEMRLLDLRQRQDERELAQMQDDLTRVKIVKSSILAAGHQSEPSTPPEYLDSASGFPGAFSRPNRYSTSSLTSPLGLYSHLTRSGSHLASPPSGLLPSRYAREEVLARSVPGSRRNSDEDEKEEALRQDPSSHHSSNGKNRYSMPVGHSRTSINEMLTPVNKNAVDKLLDEKDMLHVDPKTIVIGAGGVPILSLNNAAIYAEHRARQQSLAGTALVARDNSNSTAGNTRSDLIAKQSSMRSMELRSYLNDSQGNSQHMTLPVAPPKLISSFSTNDIPTIKTVALNMPIMDSSAHAQQQFHNHNANLGRVPVNAANNRLSRDLAKDLVARETSAATTQANGYVLHANAQPFGPAFGHNQMQPVQSNSGLGGTRRDDAGDPGYIGYQSSMQEPYNVHALSDGMQELNVEDPYDERPLQQNNNIVSHGRNMPHVNQAHVVQPYHNNNAPAMTNFTDRTVEDFQGQIYSLCKDQHGCRFLQRQIEECKMDRVHMIWLETNQHITELMIDPFGNYLCQKLLEFSNEEQRTILIENASLDLVRIAINQHGTRALQKMIELISTSRQVRIVIEALRHEVVNLIEDLNGNHVIQKCLNKLTPHDAQFIFDAVGNHCISVGTHRHGCCVLQRCIDHASGDQKARLIHQITDNARHLVQNGFGNYVLQYILDLNEPAFTEPLVMMFQGSVCALSRHKFSSNVIEKAIRCAQDSSVDMLVEEMLHPAQIGKLVRDGYSNYVIQTALDYCRPATRQRLVDAIRPILPEIRSTPYGRRIQAKVNGSNNRAARFSGPTVHTYGGVGRAGRTSTVANNGSFVPVNVAQEDHVGHQSYAGRANADSTAAHLDQTSAGRHSFAPAQRRYGRGKRGGPSGNYI